MKKIIQHRGFWISIFALIFLAAMDFYWWGNESLEGPLGIPNWVWFFIAIQFILVGAIYFFNKFFWK